MTPEVITVSQFIEVMNETLRYAFPQVTVEGEVSTLRFGRNRYIYFDLKTTSRISTALCGLRDEAADRGRDEGSCREHAEADRQRRFSLTVKSITPSGEGAIKRAYEAAQAEARGLRAVRSGT